VGSFILNGLLRIMPKAMDIWCVDVNETKGEIEDRIAKSDVIFLCVPIEKTASWIIEYYHLLQGKIIFEQASLKKWIYNFLESEKIHLDIRSMHILFRPSQTPNFADRRIAFIRSQDDDELPADIANMLNSTIVWYNKIEEHDKDMAIQQALVHRILLVLSEALEDSQGTTYISRKVMELCDRIKSGNKSLYEFIQHNEQTNKTIQRFVTDLDNFNINNYWK
jgi:prephenate dehydrogenase